MNRKHRICCIRMLAGIGGCAAVLLSGCSLAWPGDGAESTGRGAAGEGNFGAEDAAAEARTALAAVKAEAGSERAGALEEYFRQGDYAQAREMAEDLRSLSEAGTEDRDVAEFILGVSQYHLGRNEEAEEILEAHAKAFPESRHRESARFYRGSNLARLHRWRVAAGALDAFLAEYPESVLAEYALLERAECQLALGEPERALEGCETLERQFVYSRIRDRAMAMKGEILEKRGEHQKAGAAYAKAAEIARKLDHPRALATSLAGLIRVTAAEGDYASSARHYGTFFENFAKSPEAVEAALAGLPAMREQGKLEAGLDGLEAAILGMDPGTPAGEMRKALRGYAEYYGEGNGPEKLLRKFDDLSSRTGDKKRLHEQVVVARLEALETHFQERAAEIRVFYGEILAHFNRDDLSAETLVKLGRHASLSDLAEAEDILESALARGDNGSKDTATLELAKVRAAMPDPAKQHLAIVGFRKVLDVYGKPELAEQATLGLARLHTRREDWANALVFWKAYTRRPEWSAARDEAEKQLALVEAKAGSGPERPAAPAVAETSPPSAKARGVFERGYFRASAQAETGNRRGAYETLNSLLGDVGEEEAKSLKGAEKRAYRQATSLHQDLGVELGLGLLR